jgi:hypothetical protein
MQPRTFHIKCPSLPTPDHVLSPIISPHHYLLLSNLTTISNIKEGTIMADPSKQLDPSVPAPIAAKEPENVTLEDQTLSPTNHYMS